MTTGKKLTFQIVSILICMAILMSYIPTGIYRASAAAPAPVAVLSNTDADPGTAHTFETMMGTDADGNR